VAECRRRRTPSGFPWKSGTTGFRNPVRAYIDELLPDILEGRIEPGRVFDRAVDLDGVPTATAR
jgi:hypothetical protein